MCKDVPQPRKCGDQTEMVQGDQVKVFDFHLPSAGAGAHWRCDHGLKPSLHQSAIPLRTMARLAEFNRTAVGDQPRAYCYYVPQHHRHGEEDCFEEVTEWEEVSAARTGEQTGPTEAPTTSHSAPSRPTTVFQNPRTPARPKSPLQRRDQGQMGRERLQNDLPCS